MNTLSDEVICTKFIVCNHNLYQITVYWLKIKSI